MPTSTASQTEFDTIVIGVGGMGSATCLELARRGMRVLGLEQFSFVHDRGSSHGESRIIRKAYFEHTDYVPLLHRAYDRWHELERVVGEVLLRPTGLVLSGSADGETIRGARLSAERHGIELQNLTSKEACQRFQGLEFPVDHDVAFEPGAGTLFVEECVRVQLQEAIRCGATLKCLEPVIDWVSDGKTVLVRTESGQYTARNLVVTAGAWAAGCMKSIGIKLAVLRKFVGWFPVQTGEYTAERGIPTYFFEFPQGTFYGFPSFDGKTIKVAEHSGGQPVLEPLDVDRACHASDLERLQGFLKTHLPRVELNPSKHSICLYTMTPDQHFVIDVHPQWNNVAFAAGFSGHGFKFCPVVGEALADLVQFGKTSLPIGFLNFRRLTAGSAHDGIMLLGRNQYEKSGAGNA